LNFSEVGGEEPDGIAIEFITEGEHDGYDGGEVGDFLFGFVPWIDVVSSDFA
jgi:hypothetical protein